MGNTVKKSNLNFHSFCDSNLDFESLSQTTRLTTTELKLMFELWKVVCIHKTQVSETKTEQTLRLEILNRLFPELDVFLLKCLFQSIISQDQDHITFEDTALFIKSFLRGTDNEQIEWSFKLYKESKLSNGVKKEHMLKFVKSLQMEPLGYEEIVHQIFQVENLDDDQEMPLESYKSCCLIAPQLITGFGLIDILFETLRPSIFALSSALHGADIRFKKEGHLCKNGVAKRTSKWKRYWFVLDAGCLCYFHNKDQRNGQSKKMISVYEMEISLLPPLAGEEDFKPFSLSIVSPGETFAIAAESRFQICEWIVCIIIAKLFNQNRSPPPDTYDLHKMRKPSLKQKLLRSREDRDETNGSSGYPINLQISNDQLLDFLSCSVKALQWKSSSEVNFPLRVRSFGEGLGVERLSGPTQDIGGKIHCNEEGVESKDGRVYCRSSSTYPINTFNGERTGDPICDFYRVGIHSDVIIVALADGCNWGLRPREAADRATETFVSYLEENFISLIDETLNEKSLGDVKKLLLSALAAAHNSILEGKSHPSEAGTCTLIGGLLLPVERIVSKKKANAGWKPKMWIGGEKNKEAPPKSEEKTSSEPNLTNTGQPANGYAPNDGKWLFMCVNIGDCKVYYYNVEQKIVKDITTGNRHNDPTDPGGRLGPYQHNHDSSHADLRNLGLYLQECNKGDLIIIATDGVHDNFDPEFQGIDPKDISSMNSKWDEINGMECMQMKSNHICNYIRDSINEIKQDTAVSPKPPHFQFINQDSKLSHSSLTIETTSTTTTASTSTNMIGPASPTVPSRLGPLHMPRLVTNKLLQKSFEVTKNTRDFMEQNPTQKTPIDYKLFPGKPDHATCITLQVASSYSLLDRLSPYHPSVFPASPNSFREKVNAEATDLDDDEPHEASQNL